MGDIHSTDSGGDGGDGGSNLPNHDASTPLLLVDSEETRVAATACAPDGWSVATCDPTQIDHQSYLGYSQIVVWGRNDDGGRVWGEAVAERLGRPHHVVPALPAMPAHWDLSQPLPNGLGLQAIHRQLSKFLARCQPPKLNGHAHAAAHHDADAAERAAIIAVDAAPQPLPQPVAIDPKAPMTVARIMVDEWYTAGGHRTLHHQQQEFFAYTGTHYRALLPEESRAAIYRFLDNAVVPGNPDRPVKPNRSLVGNVEDALRAVCQLDGDVRAPAWLEPKATQPPASEVIAARNTLLHLPTGRTLPHTPLFFTPSALGYDYRADAPAPANWLAFLASVWPDDAECISTLQEMFGYLLSGATNQQKLFLLIGPKRSGKGTISEIISHLLGEDAVAHPTLSALETNFGLAPLIGKTTAVVSDARLGGKADQAVVAERLLSISGEDRQTIDRKFLGAWSGRLGVRFAIMTNEMPRITDSSGALASRFIIMTMRRSFFGHEDLTLKARIKPEMPGILNWAIEGYRRLTKRGHFQQPTSSQEAVREMEDLSSPITTFVRECCTTTPSADGELWVSKDYLFTVWNAWAKEQGRTFSTTKATFGKDLNSVVPGLETIQRTDAGGKRFKAYSGIRVENQPDDFNF